MTSPTSAPSSRSIMIRVTRCVSTHAPLCTFDSTKCIVYPVPPTATRVRRAFDMTCAASGLKWTCFSSMVVLAKQLPVAGV